MIDTEHDCRTPGSFALVPRLADGRCWLELCPVCGPRVGDQIMANDGMLYRVEGLQPGGPWPGWTPGLNVYRERETYRHSFIPAGWGYEIKKRREELVAELLMA